MKAVRFYAKEDVRVEDVRAPDALGDSQVLIKPRTCGICGTDLHEFAGGPIVTPATPHKFTGAVLQSLRERLGRQDYVLPPVTLERSTL